MTWVYPKQCAMSPPVVGKVDRSAGHAAGDLAFVAGVWNRIGPGFRAHLCSIAASALAIVEPVDEPNGGEADVDASAEPRKPMGFVMPEKNEKQFSAENV